MVPGFWVFHPCNKLADKFEKIFVVDIAPIKSSEYPENVVYSQVDVRNFTAVNGVLSKVDVVVHAAAAYPMEKAKLKPKKYAKNTDKRVCVCQ